MKRRLIRISSIYICILLVILCGCWTTITNTPLLSGNEMANDGKYYIGVRDTTCFNYDTHYAGKFNSWGDFVITFPWVEIPSDYQLAVKVNNTIVEATTSWITAIILYPREHLMQIMCHTDRFLSILEWYEFDIQSFTNQIFDYITVDMQTGERVFLDDLVIVNDEFIDLLKKGDIVRPTYNTMQYDGNVNNLRQWLDEISLDDLKGLLDECSKDMPEFTYEDSVFELIFRGNFHLEPGELILTFGNGIDHNFTIPTSEIKQFLKVEAW